MKKVLLLWLVLITAAFVYSGGSKSVSTTKYVDFVVSDAGDTEQVVFVAPSSALDSFPYIDSISYQADTTAHKTIKWVSPYQVMRLTPSAVWDAATVVNCSLQLAACTVGFVVDPGATYTTAAKMCDTLTSLINATAVMTDSITAQDSGTYVKIIDLNSTETHGKRWTIKKVLTGGTGSTLDTSSYVTTIAMVCDSMVAAVNASANLDSFVTAANTGDTGYFITSDDNGVLFFVAALDTIQDTTTTQANVTSHSTKTDTLMELPILLSDESFRALGYNGDIILTYYSLADTLYGMTNSDSGYIWIYTYKTIAGNKVYRPLDSASKASLPCTLHVARIPEVANDTLFWRNLVIVCRVTDTMTNTNLYRQYPVYIDLNLTEM